MKHRYILLLLLFLNAGCTRAGEVKEPEPESSYRLTNTNATVETQALWSMLCGQYGKTALSGVVANIDWNTREAENVYQWTGR